MNKIVKKAVSVALCAALLGSSAAILPLFGSGTGVTVNAAQTYGNYEYEISGNSITITKYKGPGGNVAVPSVINGKPVKKLGFGSFGEFSMVKNVTIPEGVEEIEMCAFMDCSELTTLIIPSSLKTIGNSAVAHCTNLKNIAIPEGVAKIDEYAFYDCGFSEVVLPYTVTSLGSSAFLHCPSMKSITIPSGVKTIGDYAVGYDVYFNKLPGFVIKGSKGSAAEKYALKNGFAFESVSIPETSVTLNKTQIVLGCGETTKLTASVLPAAATDKTVRWRTSDSYVLSVDQNGNVKAVAEGTAWITARTSGGLEKSCRITVRKAPEKITLTKGMLSIGVGESYTLGSALNEGAGCAKRTYRSSSSSIVKMTRTDWQGDFVGVTPGVAYVSVRTYNGRESTCKVTVKDAPKSVALSKSVVTLGVGESFSLSAILPEDTASAARSFRTSNSSIVKMTKTSPTGELTAVSEGSAYVTVRLFNGKEASCRINVKKAPDKISLSAKTLTVMKNGKGKISMMIPGDSGCALRTFRSSNSKVIRMTKTNWTGEFQAVGNGTAWITGRTYNGKEASCKIVVKAGKKIYLSPSNQLNNYYSWGNTTERDQCNIIAEATKKSLERCGFEVKKAAADQDMYVSIKEGNDWGADLYLPIHTTRRGPDYKQSGTMCMVYQKNERSLSLASPIYHEVQAISPGKYDYGIIERPELAELNGTICDAVYIEVDFHDFPEIAKWIINNPNMIAEAITRGVCRAYGVTYVLP